LRENGEGVVSGFEIERWGLEKWFGRLSLCGWWSSKFSWERKWEERVYLFIYLFSPDQLNMMN